MKRLTAPRRRLAIASVLTLAGVGLVGCSGGGGASGNSSFSYLGLQDNQVTINTMKDLSTGACSTENAALPLSTDTIPQAQLNQRLQLLSGQNALPNGTLTGDTPTTVDLIKAGKLQNLSDLGLSDQILPVAASAIDKIFQHNNGYLLPNELNIEGIWYNKQIFKDQGISVPGTWDELVSATEKLKAAGVQPLSAAGKDGWPVTRLVGDYIFRALGPDALQKVADGKAKLTDPEYVKAADAVSALGKAGAFGPSVASTDYNASVSNFLTGQSGMMYMGSWILSAFKDPEQNKIGMDSIGFMPFPAVAGGAGSIDQVPTNVGIPIVFKATDDQKAKDWISCIVKNYGTAVSEKSGVISGLKVADSKAADPLTAGVKDVISTSKESVLWFEALFSTQAGTISTGAAGQLANGSVSGSDFMNQVQSALNK